MEEVGASRDEMEDPGPGVPGDGDDLHRAVAEPLLRVRRCRLLTTLRFGGVFLAMGSVVLLVGLFMDIVLIITAL